MKHLNTLKTFLYNLCITSTVIGLCAALGYATLALGALLLSLGLSPMILLLAGVSFVLALIITAGDL